MKRIFTFITGLFLLSLDTYAAGDSPVPVPSVGNGRLRVCGQNLRNYYFYYTDSDRPDYSNASGFAKKTRQIVDMILWVDADVYAFCEVEARDIVLRQLVDSLNARVDGTPYSTVNDYINVPSSERSNNIKSGFIYRNDKVKPYGNNNAGSTQFYYRETMRIQAFKELATGGCFTLSMNHFKAKDSTPDGGEGTRNANANNLLNALITNASDPDILIMGDLNCEVGESPLTIIENAGYNEQLLRYNKDAITHCYGGGELIDHVYANSGMEAQITGAAVYHLCTSCSEYSYLNYNYRYSDHDPYIIGINLKETVSDLQDMNESRSQVRKVLENGVIYIIMPDGSKYSVTGQRIL